MLADFPDPLWVFPDLLWSLLVVIFASVWWLVIIVLQAYGSGSRTFLLTGSFGVNRLLLILRGAA